MARQRVYTGTYHHNRSRTFITLSRRQIKCFVRYFKQKFYTVCDFVMDYYLLFGTIVFVLVMNFIFPDLVHKINTSKEIITLKKMVNLMSKEVNRAEVACLTAADDLCYLQCTMQDGFTGTTKSNVRDHAVCTSCLQIRSEPPIEKNVGFFRRIFFPKKCVSQQEITLMSYVYTNSLDAKKSKNATS